MDYVKALGMFPNQICADQKWNCCRLGRRPRQASGIPDASFWESPMFSGKYLALKTSISSKNSWVRTSRSMHSQYPYLESMPANSPGSLIKGTLKSPLHLGKFVVAIHTFIFYLGFKSLLIPTNFINLNAIFIIDFMYIINFFKALDHNEVLLILKGSFFNTRIKVINSISTQGVNSTRFI